MAHRGGALMPTQSLCSLTDRSFCWRGILQAPWLRYPFSGPETGRGPVSLCVLGGFRLLRFGCLAGRPSDGQGCWTCLRRVAFPRLLPKTRAAAPMTWQREGLWRVGWIRRRTASVAWKSPRAIPACNQVLLPSLPIVSMCQSPPQSDRPDGSIHCQQTDCPCL